MLYDFPGLRRVLYSTTSFCFLARRHLCADDDGDDGGCGAGSK